MTYLGGECCTTLENALVDIKPHLQVLHNTGYLDVDYEGGTVREHVDFGFSSDKKMVCIETGKCSNAGNAHCIRFLMKICHQKYVCCHLDVNVGLVAEQ